VKQEREERKEKRFEMGGKEKKRKYF